MDTRGGVNRMRLSTSGRRGRRVLRPYEFGRLNGHSVPGFCRVGIHRALHRASMLPFREVCGLDGRSMVGRRMVRP